MRGFGGMQVALGYEGQMDRLAWKLGIDPLELRRRNFVERGDTLPIGQELETSVELPALVDALSERAGALPEPSGPRRAVGRGYACNLQPYGRCIWLNDWSSAWIGFELDGTLTIRIAVPDIGGGQASSLIQIASEVLGVAPERISIHIGDSALNPLTGTTTATRQLYMSGNAVLKAAQELRESLAGVAAGLLEVDVEQVEFGPDGVGERGGGRTIPFTELLAAAASVNAPWHVLATHRAPKGVPWQADENWRGRVFPDFTYGCHAVDVEVDLDTGQVRVLHYVAGHDVGKAINPQSVEGQIEGAVAMGLGYALSERVVFEEGQNLTTTFAQYLIPTAVEVPAIEPLVLESGEGMGPFNARGIGEPPIGPPAPAVAAAIHDACGITLTELPFTPERVVTAIENGEEADAG
jgi:CO/xanthine dehydrogenase Mo-binding subunit